jgi:heme exporter protein D
MNLTSWIMEGYNIYILPSYLLTLFCIGFLFVRSIYQSKKAKNLLEKLLNSDY